MRVRDDGMGRFCEPVLLSEKKRWFDDVYVANVNVFVDCRRLCRLIPRNALYI